ncbi:hypothetical protein ACWGRN_31475, partial [Streptomyces albidoflavus]
MTAPADAPAAGTGSTAPPTPGGRRGRRAAPSYRRPRGAPPRRTPPRPPLPNPPRQPMVAVG